MKKFTVLLFVFVLVFLFYSAGTTTYAVAKHYRNGIIQIKKIQGVAYYHIYYKESGAKSYNFSIADIPESSTQYTVGYLLPGVSYEYKIVAFDSSQQKIWESARRWIWLYE